jgi:hypothetical protein
MGSALALAGIIDSMWRLRCRLASLGGFEHRGRNEDRLDRVLVVEEGIEGAVAADRRAIGGIAADLSPAEVLGFQLQKGRRGLLQVCRITETVPARPARKRSYPAADLAAM